MTTDVRTPAATLLDAAPATLDAACCPRCGASDALLSLLTSMTRYFACRRCDCRWEVLAGGRWPCGKAGGRPRLRALQAAPERRRRDDLCVRIDDPAPAEWTRRGARHRLF